MDNMFKVIQKDLMVKLGTTNEDDIMLIQSISNGLSGAQVYKVELKGACSLKGYYFLKIEEQSIDINRNSYSIEHFSIFVECALKLTSNGYSVFILKIAGNSSYEFSSFYSIKSPKKQKEIVQKMITEMLNVLTNKSNVIGKRCKPIDIFKRHLGTKLNEGSYLHTFLMNRYGNESIDRYSCIKIDDQNYPDPFIYAKSAELWRNIEIRCTQCIIHGDFHGDNIFVSKETNEYVLIDLSQDEGYLFFDEAYLELSLLLADFKDVSIHEWTRTIEQISNNKFEDLNSKRICAIESIKDTEKNWIRDFNNDGFSYIDVMKECQYFSRVLVGLNYAGKSKVTDNIRIKSFIFAAIYLKRFFALINFDNWSNGLSQQFMPLPTSTSIMEIAESCLNFSNEQQYILVAGDLYNYEISVNEMLPRINWAGVISFCSNDCIKSLKTSLEESRLIKPFVNDSKDSGSGLEQSGALWWIYLRGLHIIPDTLTKSYADWRNRYSNFMHRVISSMGESLAPNEINIIIDVNSFSRSVDTNKYLGRMLEAFDLISNTEVIITMLDKSGRMFDISEYANLHFNFFTADLSSIASYCFSYMNVVGTTKIYIPHVSIPIGNPVEAEDLRYYNAHIELVHNGLLDSDNRNSEEDKLAFYRGEPISWVAIDEEFHVYRPEIDSLINKVKTQSEERKQSIVYVAYSPGAGATVLCRVVCWQLRNAYPTVIIKSFDDNVIECLKRINSSSGKAILILIDGDFNRTDVDQLLLTLKSYNIRCIILFTYRQYSGKNSENVLGILNRDLGLKFKGRFFERMKEQMDYSLEEIERREKNLTDLATNLSMTKFRLPFFYGIYAFEDDFDGIDNYLNGILKVAEEDTKVKKTLNFLAMVTYYTSDKAIHFRYITRLLDQDGESLSKIMNLLDTGGRSFVITKDKSFRICHPVMARVFLEKQFKVLCSKQFQLVCLEFIQTLATLDKSFGSEISIHLNDLFMSIFLKREVEMDLQQDKKKKSFSQLLLDLDNINLQTELFEILLKFAPENAHYHQHYGRLLINSNSATIDAPKLHFDNAIELEDTNSFHYHARGTMYVRHIKYLLTEKLKNSTCETIYEAISGLTELAIDDFEKAIDYSKEETLVYPYSSTISIITYVVKLIYENSGFNSKNTFYQLDNDVSRWCKTLLAKANSLDTTVSSRYTQFSSNEYYKGVKQFLTRLNLETEELRKEIILHPNDGDLKRMLLREYASDHRKSWDEQRLSRLRDIYDYSAELINNGAMDEGLLWMWFNAFIRSDAFNFANFFGVLETLPQLSTNLTANFMLYIGYFCRSCSYERHVKDTENALKHIRECRRLNKGSSKRFITRLFYSNIKRFVPVTEKRVDETLYKFNCHIIGDMENGQSESLTLDFNQRFTAFFVPHATNFKKGQTFDKPVRAIIGFSYDGLRAWDLDEIKESEMCS